MSSESLQPRSSRHRAAKQSAVCGIAASVSSHPNQSQPNAICKNRVRTAAQAIARERVEGKTPQAKVTANGVHFRELARLTEQQRAAWRRL